MTKIPQHLGSLVRSWFIKEGPEQFLPIQRSHLVIGCLLGEVICALPHWVETLGHGGEIMLLDLTQDKWQRMDERMVQRL